MIIYFAQGQLGNQLFQYAFLKKYFEENELAVSLGFENLLEVTNVSENFINIPKNRFTRYLKLFKIIFSLLSKLRIITSIEVEKIEMKKGFIKESTNVLVNKGFLKNLKYIKTGAYESEVHFNNETIRSINNKDKYISKAKKFLEPFHEHDKVFIHVRLGDYLPEIRPLVQG